MILSILLLFGLGISNGFKYHQDLEQARELQNTLEQRIDQTTPPMKGPELLELKERVSFANTVLLRRSFSAVGLLDKIEKSLPRNTTLSRLEISEKGSQILLNGKNLRSRTLLKFIESLREQEGFTRVFLAKQEETSDQGISFEILCHYQLDLNPDEPI